MAKKHLDELRPGDAAEGLPLWAREEQEQTQDTPPPDAGILSQISIDFALKWWTGKI